MTCKESIEWLDAYLDQELELSRQLEIEQHLKGCPSCGQRLEARRALQTAMRQGDLRFSPPLDFDHRLRDVLQHESSGASDRPVRRPVSVLRTSAWWSGFASAAVMATLIFVAGPPLMRPVIEHQIAQDVMASHVRALMAHHLTDVENSNQHVVKPWFNGRIDFAPEVHDFSDEGFPLAGGRVDYVDHRSVAVLVYHRALHPIQLFIWPTKSEKTSPLESLQRNGYHFFHWSEGGMAYWAISDLNAAELREFAEHVRSVKKM